MSPDQLQSLNQLYSLATKELCSVVGELRDIAREYGDRRYDDWGWDDPILIGTEGDEVVFLIEERDFDTGWQTEEKRLPIDYFTDSRWKERVVAAYEVKKEASRRSIEEAKVRHVEAEKANLKKLLAKYPEVRDEILGQGAKP